MCIIIIKWVVEKSRKSGSGCAASVSPRIPSAPPGDLFISTALQMSAILRVLQNCRRLWAIFITEDEINRRSIVLAGVLSLLFHCGDLCAQSITAHQAEKAVRGWLGTDARHLQTIIGRESRKVQSFTDEAGEPIYYVASLEPSGFVIVSADDELEPIICFADDGVYDPSPENPLGALVSSDLKGRMAAVRALRRERSPAQGAPAGRTRDKWKRLVDLGESGIAGSGEPGGGISDVRVAPLLQSKWSQHAVCQAPFYNYYTPDNYRTGCAATAMAQLMRYHQHPTEPIGVLGFWIKKDSSDWFAAYTRGGDGSGGPYNWDQMVLVPDCSTIPAVRNAVAGLCYDAAISINTDFGSLSSQADTLKAGDSLVDTFQYARAVKGYNSGGNIGEGLIGMINPNLDAKDPVIIGINGSSGHAAVCDGYGYNSSTLYHHLNMGWGGTYDAWYNLPNIDSNPTYSSIYKCVYNIRRAAVRSGEVISGRVYDPKGRPIANPTVCAQLGGQGAVIYAESDSRGIYAFDDLKSAATYLTYVAANGYGFTGRTVKTGTSADNSPVSGNVWGVDFYGQYPFGSLIAHWKLDETSGSIAADSAGVNDGMLQGSTNWRPSGGVCDGALFFDGNDCVAIPYESNFDMINEITVAAWVNIDVVDKDWQTVIAKGDSAWRLSTLGNQRKFYFCVTGPPNYAAVDGSAIVPTHEWHHVCGTYDKANIRLYIDGMEDPAGPTTYSGGITTNNFDVFIGENAEKTGRYWKGLIDDVRIYNYALRPGDVAQLMCHEPSVGDVNHDCIVDMADFAVLTSAWLSRPGDQRWNEDCDISPVADNVIDMLDLNAFFGSWLAGDR